jgi:hypothetical protein
MWWPRVGHGCGRVATAPPYVLLVCQLSCVASHVGFLPSLSLAPGDTSTERAKHMLMYKSVALTVTIVTISSYYKLHWGSLRRLRCFRVCQGNHPALCV